MMKMSTLRKRQAQRNARERRDLIREALVEGGWTYAAAAKLLEMTTSGVQMAVERDETLKEERDQKAPRAGIGGKPAA